MRTDSASSRLCTSDPMRDAVPGSLLRTPACGRVLSYPLLRMEARMRIFGMGLPELLVILAVILLIFGPKNLPKLGSALGKTVKNLRDGMGGDKEGAEETEEAPAEKPAPKSSSKTEE